MDLMCATLLDMLLWYEKRQGPRDKAVVAYIKHVRPDYRDGIFYSPCLRAHAKEDGKSKTEHSQAMGNHYEKSKMHFVEMQMRKR